MSCGQAARLALTFAAGLALASGCGGDAEREPRGHGGTGASGGNAGASGSASNPVGQAGHAGRGGVGGISSGCPSYRDDVGTRVSGQSFSYPDGTAVTAIFGVERPQTTVERLEDGAFQLSFFQGGSCTTGQRYVPAALYIDADGDGVCRLATDEIFVWLPSGGSTGTNQQVVFSPVGPHCPTSVPDYLAADVVAAVRQLCPEISDCLPFCEPSDPMLPGSGGNGAACAGTDAGAQDSGVDIGNPTNLDAAVVDAAP
jgi:hypothetical protein